ncbi:Calcium-dependent kinase 29 [Micractinium conductrix]|uniref:Calcium-dependent kinase 29 n=1 Tax=Micractinium conductrix TaxID=554055 RepID=A0A2P6VIY6_9CHLO|nr:Calcium-dependent kinase 29 [Micractinium conductrix]|eukprot:PSC74049.1 Calcium-dependent kinase 29 [Micractinium conductrix]
MPRIDIWDVEAAKNEPAVDCGFPRDLETRYEWGRVLGKGGFGLVRTVVEKRSGIEFACKSVSKTLDIPNLSPQKQAQHLDNIKREIKILTRLRGTLSVVHFKGAYEDDHSIHMVMELCRGGELVHEIGRRPYTEKTVAGYMRAVLHTLAQCHSHRILHRDIKPGNFMLLTADEESPLKAIDFGLAVFFDPDKLPRTDLGLEGTPWFMAPETLSSQTFPSSDVWAAGVMAYQLLSGYLPFDDPRNPNAPSLSAIWKGILTEQPSFRRSAWKEVSEEAKDFVKALLDKDHTKRPSAKEALRHPWLSAAFHEAKQRPLSATVVQRIQRFAQTNVLRRTILELIAQELLKLMPAMSPTVHGPGEYGYMAVQQPAHLDGSSPRSPPAPGGVDGQAQPGEVFPMSPDAEGGLATLQACPFSSPDVGRSASINIAGRPPRPSLDSVGGGSSHGGDSFRAGSLLGRLAQRGPGGSAHGGRLFRRSPSTQQLQLLARGIERSCGSASVHGPGDYFRVMRQASELAAMSSGHGSTDYLRVAPRTQDERLAARKAARLSLDTSAHGGDDYHRLLHQLETIDHKHKLAGGSMRQADSAGSLLTSQVATAQQQEQQQQQQQQPAAQQEQQQQEQQQQQGPAGWPQLAAQPGVAPAPAPAPAPVAAGSSEAAAADGEKAEQAPAAEERGRGRGAAKALLQRMSAEPSGSGCLPTLPESPTAAQQPDLAGSAAFGVAGGALGGPFGAEAAALAGGGADAGSRKRVSFAGGGGAEQPTPMALDAPQAPQGPTLATFSAAAATGSGGGGGKGSGPVGEITNPRDLEQLMRRMHFRSNKGLGPDDMSEGLRQLGYDLEPSEVAILMQQLDLDADGQVQAPEFVASQLDWAALQESKRDLWLECARRAFEGLEGSAAASGKLSVDALMATLRDKLPAQEVDYAVEDALLEAGYTDADEVDFDGFLRMLRIGSYDSLDALEQYDARYAGSMHGRHNMDLEDHRLESVPEETPRGAAGQ